MEVKCCVTTIQGNAYTPAPRAVQVGSGNNDGIFIPCKSVQCSDYTILSVGPFHLTRRSGSRKLIMLSGNGVTDVSGSFRVEVATGFERYFDLPYVDPIAVDYQPVRIVFAEIPHVVASPRSVHVQSGAPPPPPVTMTTQIEMLAHDMSVEPSEWAPRPARCARNVSVR